MNSCTFDIDPRLLNDSHELFSWNQCHIRLHKNATLPWLLIIPETDEVEFCDLAAEQQTNITYLGKIMGQYMKTEMGAEKINFAAIGNVVQKLHVHVIGRNHLDPLWPDVVWGASLPAKNYTEQQIKKLKGELKSLLPREQA